MSNADIWADFDTIRHNVKHNTVDRLKQIILSFNEQCNTSFTRAGKKQELIDRITRELDLWRRTNSSDRWLKAKTILSTVRASTMYNTYTNGTYSVSQAASFAAPSITPTHYQPRPPSAIPAYDPYAPPRRPAAPPAAAPSTSTSPGLQFKHSPFYRVERTVSSVTECPESTSQIDRRSQSVSFYLSTDVLAKLESTSPRYQLRLYCTSSTYHAPAGSFRAPSGPCPIEFPPTCEVRVNGQALTANLKGMKKKPGTAPPPDIGKHVRMSSTASNRIEMVYVNSQNPAPAKKYYLIVMLVEVTTVEQLIERLRKGKYKSNNEIVDKMAQASLEDDDIVAGSQKLSLKCPLSYMRIATPCRSAHCVHSQCFDAFSWYSVMEQTTTWLCPVCEKVLNTEDLIVDGYFDEILKETDEDVEDVIVEADGQWHTVDNMYGSTAWKAAHPPVKDPPPQLPPAPVKKRSPTPVIQQLNGDATAKSGPSNAEIVILDSDDEDEGQVKRELSPSAPRSLKTPSVSVGSLPPRSQTGDSDVIDLTLDSDDEDTLMNAHSIKKRKSDERDLPSPTERIWKKSRIDMSPGGSVPRSPPLAYATGSSYSPPSRDSSRDPRVLPPPSPNRYNAANYVPRSTVPAYAPAYIPPGGAPVPARPPVPTYPASPSYAAQPNGSASSSVWRT
ncbi:hypothetical protein PHLGIDRAFT_114515 [Phlebiopsis gigantea 11061_1 CR5-6]|uniref:SP-RING-type domain-containing protein n=1 Tax=Phlebiopsis gigantea (strain 11061_1 CR5-6) TaxID=745531 RepID=A0A0C3S5P9_PHLG1|nr:hypothetical protein PHLGIDRAFT_114515 [Phlebiopsis gigantea 11061_1 CR5-6]